MGPRRDPPDSLGDLFARRQRGDALLAAGAPIETAERNSQLYTHAFSSSMFGVLNDDVLDVTRRPPVSFGEFAVGTAAAWRR